MMGDTSIELWLNQHRFDALEQILNEDGMSIEKVMQDQLIELYTDTVPIDQQKKIDELIAAERLADEQTAQEIRRFSVYHVTENGTEHYFESDYAMDMLRTAWQIRKYLRADFEKSPENFAAIFDNAIPIDAQRFNEHVGDLLNESRNIAGVFDIDFDKQEISGVHRFDGWKTYSMKDISVATYQAYRKDYRSWDERWDIFLDRLEGREITAEYTPMLTQDM